MDTKFKEFEKELSRVLKAVRTLGLAEDQPPAGPSEDEINSLPPDVAQDAAKCIREAADMGNVTQLKLVAEELTSQTQSFASIGKNIVQFAEEFDFDAIKQLADKLEKQAK